LRIKAATHDVITNTRQVFDTTTTNKHHRVFLKIVAFAANIGNNLEAIGQTHLGDLP